MTYDEGEDMGIVQKAQKELDRVSAVMTIGALCRLRSGSAIDRQTWGLLDKSFLSRPGLVYDAKIYHDLYSHHADN